MEPSLSFAIGSVPPMGENRIYSVKAQNPRLEPRMEYDVDLYWECNLDNEDYIDRCREARIVA